MEAMKRFGELSYNSNKVNSKNNLYSDLNLLELQMEALQEDIPRNLVERRSAVTDLEMFDMKITAMRNRLHRAIEYLLGGVMFEEWLKEQEEPK